MVEAGAKEVTEEQVVDALEAAHAAIKQIVATIDDLAQGRPARRSARSRRRKSAHDFYREVEEKVLVPLTEAMRIRGKLENYDRVDEVLDELVASLPEGEVAAEGRSEAHLQGAEGEGAARRGARARRAPRRPQVRRDPRRSGREVGVLPRTHGSAVFTRGETQALVTVHARHRRRPAEDRDASTARTTSASCCTTTSRRSRSAKSRSCAAPAAAKWATARWPSARSRRWCRPRRSSRTRSASSPTSSSRTARRRWRRSAAASMAMMDAGVPIKAPVAGIAMGLVMDETDGQVRHPVATSPAPRTTTATWTSRSPAPPTGITALQMDIKVTGITADVMREALEQARAGRLHILGKMAETLADAARQHLDLRAAHHHDQDSGRQDPRRHRPGRQDDPQHHRAHRREDRRRGRWPRERRVGRRGVGAARRSRSSRS